MDCVRSWYIVNVRPSVWRFNVKAVYQLYANCTSFKFIFSLCFNYIFTRLFRKMCCDRFYINCVEVLRIRCDLLSDPSFRSTRLNYQRVYYDWLFDPYQVGCDVWVLQLISLFINQRFVTIYPTVYYIFILIQAFTIVLQQCTFILLSYNLVDCINFLKKVSSLS